MPTKSTETVIHEDGSDKEALQIVFTNGSLQQLKDLAPLLNVKTPAEVVEKAIGLVEAVKHLNEQSKDK